MGTVNSSHVKTGMKLLIQGEPCNVIGAEFVKPGKGSAFARLRIRNLKTGRVNELTFKSGETIEMADVIETDMTYLYNDGDSWTFMNDETYDQISAGEAAVADALPWIREQDTCKVVLWNGVPISVEAPTFVSLEVTDCEPNVKGDTVTGGKKPATVETGTTVNVPLFVEIGDKIKIDTRNSEYLGRDKD